MMARKMLLALFLVSGAFVGLASTASAQTQSIQVQISCSQGPDSIRPLGPPGRYSCTAQPSSTGSSFSDPVRFLTVTLEAPNAPNWANVIISPKSLSWVNQGNEGWDSRDFQVAVALTQNAPAFQAQSITITGEANIEGQQQGTTATQVLDNEITVVPGYFNLYNVRLTKKIGDGGPQESVVYPIQIDNFSNGQTRFEFALTNSDNVPAGFQPVVPEPTVLQSQAGGGDQTSTQVQFSVYTPFKNGYVNRQGAIQLTVNSFYAPDTSIQGTSSQVSTLTQATGFYVPGPGAGLAALAMAGVALGLTRVVRKD